MHRIQINKLLCRLCFCLFFLQIDSVFACPMEGNWHGKLGNKSITMQLGLTTFENQSHGSYFYDQSGEELFLNYDIEKDAWTEQTMSGIVTGHITAISCDEETLTAIWHSTNNQSSYAITAVRTETYHSSWHIPLELDKKTYHFRQHAYRILKGKGTNSYTIQITDADAGKEKLNVELTKRLQETLDEHLSCFHEVRNMQSQGNGYAESTYKIIDWNTAYLVLYSSWEQYCGQAHPLYSAGGNVFSLQTGHEVDTSKWLKQNTLLDTKFKQIDKNKPLGKLLEKRYLASLEKEMVESCTASVDFYNFPWVTRAGFFFRTSSSYAANACNSDVLIPFSLINPYLTQTGKRAIRSFQQKDD
ncbi:hypothetical protein [Methylophilus sp. OH31]|uniref:hypothetical protein n=1 Tax=Methylophilus sp. OH31 TaxID=1387312 RepID=UPI0004B63222|nr:hypothetical protein [Methylophilus sp. OH31]